jgi:energy-converting hydrogenase Eha subunit C
MVLIVLYWDLLQSAEVAAAGTQISLGKQEDLAAVAPVHPMWVLALLDKGIVVAMEYLVLGLAAEVAAPVQLVVLPVQILVETEGLGCLIVFRGLLFFTLAAVGGARQQVHPLDLAVLQ